MKLPSGNLYAKITAVTQEREPSRWQRAVGNVLLVVAVVLLGFSADQLFKGLERRRTWCRVQGVVVNMVRPGSAADFSEKPLFTFKNPATGKRHTVKSILATDPPRFRIGQRVELLYPEGEPEKAIANTVLDLFHLAIGLGIGAIVTAIFGLSLRRRKHDLSPEIEGETPRTRIRISGWEIPLPQGLLGRLFSFPELSRKKQEPPAEDTPTEDEQKP